MLNPLFFLISRFNIACSPLIFNLQINYPIRIKDIPFKSFQLRSHKYSGPVGYKNTDKQANYVYTEIGDYINTMKTTFDFI